MGMLEARELLCERDERTLFSGLSFTLNAGEWVQITGSNGAGKTTLLRLLTGLSRPDAGDVLLARAALASGTRQLPSKPVRVRPPAGDQNPADGVRKSALLSSRWRYRTMSGSPGAGRACRIRRYSGKSTFCRQQRRVALARLWLTRATLWILRRAFYRD